MAVSKCPRFTWIQSAYQEGLVLLVAGVGVSLVTEGGGGVSSVTQKRCVYRRSLNSLSSFFFFFLPRFPDIIPPPFSLRSLLTLSQVHDLRPRPRLDWLLLTPPFWPDFSIDFTPPFLNYIDLSRYTPHPLFSECPFSPSFSCQPISRSDFPFCWGGTKLPPSSTRTDNTIVWSLIW